MTFRQKESSLQSNPSDPRDPARVQAGIRSCLHARAALTHHDVSGEFPSEDKRGTRATSDPLTQRVASQQRLRVVPH